MSETGRNVPFRIAVIALAVVVGVIAWIATRDDGGSPPAPPEAERVVSEDELVRAAAALTHPVYWAGPVPGTELELVESSGGTQVRYVADGGEPGESLTIGSYPLASPSQAIRKLTAEPGATVRTGRGRTVVSIPKAPTSAYFASPDDSVQVEVYDPSPRRAMSLALSSQVRPVR